jgi:hypothetical protein
MPADAGASISFYNFSKTAERISARKTPDVFSAERCLFPAESPQKAGKTLERLKQSLER